MNKQYSVSMQNLEAHYLELQELLGKSPLLSVTVADGSTGKWSMTKLWRSWMASTAKFMAANGAVMPMMIKANGDWYGSRPFNADDAHELFTHQYLGADERGDRLSWKKRAGQGEVAATKGQRVYAMQRHQAWMTEKGIEHMVPRDSEYYKALQESES